MSGGIVHESNVTLDDHVDAEIASFLNLTSPRSFFLFAGAGSGKTRSLVSALNHVRKEHGSVLRRRGQQVAVITYTNAACDEITSRIDFDNLFLVRTIHSFAWELIHGFNRDIKEWLKTTLTQDILEIQEEERKGHAGTKASIGRLAQIEAKQSRFARLADIKSFTYNPTGDNREKNSLNHSEVIKILAAFLSEKPLMQRIVVEKYPFLLIDESQDTSKALIDAFLVVEQAHQQRFCIGFIGDTMQRIFNDGKEKIESDIPPSWATPEKKLNHRCPKRVVELINKVRGQAEHSQEPRSDSIQGWVRLFVFPSDSLDKPKMENDVRTYMAKLTSDNNWNNQKQCKILTLEHHMAAKRMGFLTLFETLYKVENFRTGLLDGSLSVTHFFTKCILPLVSAQRNNDRFHTAKIVREFSPLLSKDRLRDTAKPAEQLKLAERAVESLMSLWTDGNPTCGSVLENVSNSDLFSIPDSLKPALKIRQTPTSVAGNKNEKADPLTEDMVAMLDFLNCSFLEVLPYSQYVSSEAPFDTHQGVKGLQFDRVMVIMDDAEARGFMFGYEKLLGAKEPTAQDVKNTRDGRETSIDRTRRLFYVTCSRAKSALALVAYSANPTAIKTRISQQGWFETDEIVLSL